MDIVGDLMKQATTGDNLSKISTAVGGDGKAVQSALGMGIPLIMGSMASTAAKPGGAEMLTKMLSQAGGSSSPLSSVSGLPGNPAAAGGSGMVNTLLGSQMAPIQNAISQKTGLPPAAVGKVLEIAAPMVMGYVGKMFVQQKMDAAGLASLLGEQSTAALAGSPDAAALASQVLGGAGGRGGDSGVTGMFKKVLGK